MEMQGINFKSQYKYLTTNGNFAIIILNIHKLNAAEWLAKISNILHRNPRVFGLKKKKSLSRALVLLRFLSSPSGITTLISRRARVAWRERTKNCIQL